MYAFLPIVFSVCICYYKEFFVLCRLEADIKRLKADLQSSRQSEQDLRSQVHSISVGERSVKSELLQLQQDNESLQHKSVQPFLSFLCSLFWCCLYYKNFFEIELTPSIRILSVKITSWGSALCFSCPWYFRTGVFQSNSIKRPPDGSIRLVII